MAGTKIDAATLINKVTYQTDRASLKRVRKEMKDLQALMNRLRTTAGTGPGGKASGGSGVRSSANADARRKVKEVRDEVRRLAKERVRAEKEAAQRVQKAQDDYAKRTGQSKAGRPGAGSAAASAKAFEEDFKRQEKAKAETRNREMLAQQRIIDAQRERILKARDKQEKRDRAGGRVANQMAFDASRLNLTGRAAQDASNKMEALNKRYREGAIELAEYRQQSRMLLRTMRDQSAAATTLGQRFKDLRKGGNGGLGIGGKVAGLGVLGAAGVGYMGANAARNALGSGVEQSRGLQRVGTMGISSEEVQALQLAALRETGFNLSYEKISDISKDIQDKVGQLSLGKWTTNKKTGESTFGGGGELGDWVKIMTERGGYGKQESIDTLRSAKGPLEMALILNNLKKTAKLTDAEFTALSESINDYSYITKSIGENGKNVDKALWDLANTGRLYTDQEKENLKQLSALSAEYQATTSVFEGKFSASFVEGLKQAGINSGNLGEEMAGLTPIVRELGQFVGETSGRFIKLLQWLPGGKHEQLSEGGGYYEDSWVGSGVKAYRSVFGGLDNFIDSVINGPNSVPVNSGPMSLFNSNNSLFNPYTQSSNMGKSATQLSLTIQIDPNAGELERAFSAHALDVFNNGMDDLTFDINNMTFNN